jgi:hypothetical protein
MGDVVEMKLIAARNSSGLDRLPTWTLELADELHLVIKSTPSVN